MGAPAAHPPISNAISPLVRRRKVEYGISRWYGTRKRYAWWREIVNPLMSVTLGLRTLRGNRDELLAYKDVMIYYEGGYFLLLDFWSDSDIDRILLRLQERDADGFDPLRSEVTIMQFIR